MSSDATTHDGSDGTPLQGSDGRDFPRVALVALALLAALLAAATLPALAPAGTPSPAESLVPVPGDPFGGNDAGSPGGSGSGLGTLSPGATTNVGGDVDTNPMQSQESTVHFVVHSSQPDYWRTAAYDVYTGTGWQRTAEIREGEPPLVTGPAEAGSVSYRVELNRTARALPTVWRPQTVDGVPVNVTEFGAVRPQRALPSGASYRATSVRPPRDPALLRTTGRDYPAQIEARYTDLPADTRERLTPFVDDLTANASTPYEQARQIEAWLEANKTYSLNVSQPPGDDVATEFVFEMEQGYCEYFATSMVAMLRSQDIPARYVVGYSTGQRRGDDTYVVRGMNAHAWVEVYHPDVGWVRYDPTPGRERLQAEQSAYERQENGSYSANETGSPGEQFSVGNESGQDQSPTSTPTPTPAPTPTPTPTDANDSTGGSEGGETGGGTGSYDVSLNRSAVPGVTVTATVTQSGRPVVGATVLFNGDVVGETNAAGNVTGQVPYDEELNVTVRGGRVAGGGTDAKPPRSSGGDSPRVPPPLPGQSDNTTTFDVPTDATISVSGTVATGQTVTVVATVDDAPVRGAAVRLDGRRVATTNAAGRADVTLPTAPGTVRVSVERDAVSGNRTLELDPLNVSVEPAIPLALPGGPVHVNATLGGEPVPGAPISIGGRQTGTTGVDGTAAVSLPLADSATIAVGAYGQTAAATLSGLFVNLALVLGALALVVAGIAVLVRRYEITPASIAAALRSAGEWVVAALVGLGAAADSAMTRLRERAGQTLAHLRALLAGTATPSELLAALQAWLRDRRDEVGDWTRQSVNGTNGKARVPDARRRIRAAWRSLLRATSVPRARSRHRTPGEIATHAVERDGLPPAAVRTLRDAFRAVEYGGRDPDDRLSAVEQAQATIQRSVREPDHGGRSEDGSHGDGTGGAIAAGGGQPTRDGQRQSDGDGTDHDSPGRPPDDEEVGE